MVGEYQKSERWSTIIVMLPSPISYEFIKETVSFKMRIDGTILKNICGGFYQTGRLFTKEKRYSIVEVYARELKNKTNVA